MRIHIESTHLPIFEYLLAMDKKLTGLTKHQKKLLSFFYQGKNDKEIQKELGIGSASTISHYRFALKEKERQAKTFLAMMALLKEKDEHTPAFVPVHKTATMVDERYNITQEEQELLVNKYLSKGVLTKFPKKEKLRLVILREISKHLKTVYHIEMILSKLLIQLECTVYPHPVIPLKYYFLHHYNKQFALYFSYCWFVISTHTLTPPAAPPYSS
jgi:DNA-binding CsgD family transcriptional regulator